MVRFARVSHAADRVAIFGTGASLAGGNWRLPATVTALAVNGAIALLPRANVWFTLDASPANRRLMRAPRPSTVYYAAVPDDYGTPEAACRDHRDPPEDGVTFLRRLSGDGHGRLRTRSGLSPDPGVIHTGNSAWGALQLAVHMQARKIALFGVDGHGDYVTGGRPRDLTTMPGLFASAVADLERLGVEVVNGSPTSTVTCFARVSAGEAVEWLAR